MINYFLNLNLLKIVLIPIVHFLKTEMMFYSIVIDHLLPKIKEL